MMWCFSFPPNKIKQSKNDGKYISLLWIGSVIIVCQKITLTVNYNVLKCLTQNLIQGININICLLSTLM